MATYVSKITYEFLFNEVPPSSPLTLKKNIDSEKILFYLASINSLFYSDTNDFETIDKVFVNMNVNVRNQLKQKIHFYYQTKDGYSGGEGIFTALGIYENLQHELINYRKISQGLGFGMTAAEEILFIKSFFLIQNKAHHTYDLKDKDIEMFPQFKFQIAVWPSLVKSQGFSGIASIFFYHLTIIAFFEFLKENETYNTYLEKFIRTKGFTSIEEYIKEYLKAYTLNGNIRYTTSTPYAKQLSDSLSIDISALKKDSKQCEDYKAIRERPIYKARDGSYLILSWRFLHTRLSIAHIFDFYNTSGIKEFYKDDFSLFKTRLYSEIFLEKILFSRLMDYLFKTENTIVEIDNKSKNSLPDAYVRKDNVIYLFEFKDNLMPSKCVTENTFDNIRRDIHKKYVSSDRGAAKGVTQLMNYIEFLNDKSYEFDVIEGKRSNITIIQIVVYTHYMYNMPGVNHYLNYYFNEQCVSYKKTDAIKFKEILPVTMISFEMLASGYLFFKHNNKLESLVRDYHQKSSEIIGTVSALNLKSNNLMEQVNKVYTGYIMFDEVYTEHMIDEQRKIKTDKAEDEFFRFMIGKPVDK